MKKTILCLALVSLLALGGQAVAEIGVIDDVPAATLLLPYFEVQLNEDLSTDGGGITTLFEINNASAEPIIAHVTVWTDLSVPVLDFNVYLTGFDVVPINMRDILNLTLPDTAPPPPANTGKEPGEFSLATSSIPGFNEDSCDDQLPPRTLPASVSLDIREALVGLPSGILGGNCGAVPQGVDRPVARGYVTVDTVRECTLQFPGDTGYFVTGGGGEAVNANILWGNYYYVEPTENFAQAETLVHVEADGNNPETATPQNYTFYGRELPVQWTAEDNREALPTVFGARYIDNDVFTGGTDLIVWRDSRVKQSRTGFTCGAGFPPTPFPLGQNAIVIFDEMENPDVPEVFPISPQPPETGVTPFPWEAQRTIINGDGTNNPFLESPFEAGWVFLNLNTVAGVGPANAPADAAQAWVSSVLSAEGRFSVGFDAIQFDDSANEAASDADIPPGPPVLNGGLGGAAM